MSLIARLATLPVESRATPGGAVAFRRARSPGAAADLPVSHVLLHGIGSASGSWLAQLQHVAATPAQAAPRHVLAWDAPGYGASDPLPMAEPAAADYAARLWQWLDALGPQAVAPLTLVGHSLGALVAAAAALQAPGRVHTLVLLAPAGGYGRAAPELRAQKRDDRLANLARLGPAGMARERAHAMVSRDADDDQRAFVAHVMAAIRPDGYTQATHMLAGGDLAADLQRLRGSTNVVVASGSADTITPPESCRALADAGGAPYHDLGPVGHSCALQAASAVNTLIGLDAGAPAPAPDTNKESR